MKDEEKACILLVVEDTFLIKGRGMILVPGTAAEEVFRIGDSILLRRPDGSTFQWKIGGLGFESCAPMQGITLILKGLSKEDVPIGTEVWSVIEGEQAK